MCQRYPFPFSAFSINQNLATPYIQNLNFNVQQGLCSGGVLQVDM
jgi:hypothetical protein